MSGGVGFVRSTLCIYFACWHGGVWETASFATGRWCYTYEVVILGPQDSSSVLFVYLRRVQFVFDWDLSKRWHNLRAWLMLDARHEVSLALPPIFQDMHFEKFDKGTTTNYVQNNDTAQSETVSIVKMQFGFKLIIIPAKVEQTANRQPSTKPQPTLNSTPDPSDPASLRMRALGFGHPSAASGTRRCRRCHCLP